MSFENERVRYNLGYSTTETDRLLIQHEWLNNAAGYTIHPTIKAYLPSSNIEIAELATGTGIFLSTIASSLPSDTTLHGYDISDASFLSSDQLPCNISLRTMNAKGIAPPELVGKYHAVFIRYFSAALMPEEWPLVAVMALQLLKPGGYIQWYESDFAQLRTYYQPNPVCKNEACESLMGLGLEAAPHRSWGPTNLHRILQTVGFVDVQTHVFSSDRRAEDRKISSLLMFEAAYNILKAVKARTGAKNLPDATELEALAIKGRQELGSGVYSRCDMYVRIGRKL